MSNAKDSNGICGANVLTTHRKTCGQPFMADICGICCRQNTPVTISVFHINQHIGHFCYLFFYTLNENNGSQHLSLIHIWDDYIETARRKAHDLKEYIDVLFDWFKLNSNEFALEIQSVEVAELTRNIPVSYTHLVYWQ